MHIPGFGARRRADRGGGRPGGGGQSLVEFALVLPLLLLLVLGGIDFGRVFLGWVSLNNTARIAANFAASNALLVSTGNAAALASYNATVQRDAQTTNCTPPNPIPAPTFTPNAQLGSSTSVTLSCQFRILTPIISNVLGGTVTVSASSTFPVRTGIVANGPTGGTTVPLAAFNVSPASGVGPLIVNINNVSSGTITSYDWDFGDGTTSTQKDPPPVTYTVPDTYTVQLVVSNGLSTSTATRTVTVTAPPGPVANFTFAPPTGTAPLSNVAFTDTSTGTIVSWVWNMDNGNTYTFATPQNPPNQTYSTAKTYNITLTVSDALDQSSIATKPLVVTPPDTTCTVPNFKNDQTSDATITKWSAAGFGSANILFNPSRPPEYKITKQSLNAGDPFPCAGTTITVFDK